MPLSMTEIGARIRAIRERRGLGIGDLAEAAGRGDALVYRWERGERRPGPVELQAIAQRLRVSVQDILGEEELPATEPFQISFDMALDVMNSAVRDAKEAQQLRIRVAELEAEVERLRADLSVTTPGKTLRPASEGGDDGPSRSRDTQPESSAPKPARHGQGKISRRAFRRSPGSSSRSDDSEQATS